jgi:hypothetical protein
MWFHSNSRFPSRNVFVAVCVVSGALGGVALIAGCDERAESPATRSQSASPSQTAAVDTLPPGLVLAEAPAGAKDVAAVRKEVKAGDEVVLRGKVGGSLSPIVEGRASFQIVDASLTSCDQMPGDTCKTPWDYCCDDPKEVAAHSASVQVVGADGKPLRAPLAGVGGLKPLSEVTVKGTVAKAGDSGTLVVNATGIYVKG